MADALRDAGNEVEQTMYKCAWHFNKCCEQLSSKTFDATVLAQHGVAFANLYVALHQHFMVQGVCLFKVTKLHLFCEISYRGRDCPSVHWTYRDEDWGGKMAILAASKGGANTPNALANAFLVVSPRGIKFLCFKACLSPLQKKDERSKASCMQMHACMHAWPVQACSLNIETLHACWLDLKLAIREGRHAMAADRARATHDVQISIYTELAKAISEHRA